MSHLLKNNLIFYEVTAILHSDSPPLDSLVQQLTSTSVIVSKLQCLIMRNTKFNLWIMCEEMLAKLNLSYAYNKKYMQAASHYNPPKFPFKVIHAREELTGRSAVGCLLHQLISAHRRFSAPS